MILKDFQILNDQHLLTSVHAVSARRFSAQVALISRNALITATVSSAINKLTCS